MRYRIHTAPIWDAFKEPACCPLCTIEAAISERLVGQYLGEAVMAPEYRKEVNRLGFCPTHISALIAGDNKLGVSLQLGTRIDHILSMLLAPQAKRADKAAKQLSEFSQTCIICQNTAEMMSRYHETIARMYFAEKDFPPLLAASQGFCMRHFARLVEYARFAAGKTDEFLSAIYSVQRAALRAVKCSLDAFADMFDYKRGLNASGGAKDALPKAASILK